MIKVAFVGAGYMSVEHMKAFGDISGIELTGIMSRTKEKAENIARQFGIVHICDTVKDLYCKTNADIVVISVSVLETYNVCIEALDYPWLLLIEKPAGYNVEQAIKIQKKADLLDRKAFVALNRRQYSTTIRVLEDLKDNPEQRHIHVCDQEDIISARKNGQPEEVIKHWMYANSIHIVDYLNNLCRGELISVEPVISNEYDNKKIIVSKLEYSSGDTGIYEAVWNAPGPWAVTVTTKNKRWELRPLEQLTIQTYPSRNSEIIDKDEYDILFKPGLRRQAVEVIKAYKNEINNLATINDGIDTMQIIKKIYNV